MPTKDEATHEQIEAIVRNSVLDKELTRELVAEWKPLITDAEFEEMWAKRKPRVN